MGGRAELCERLTTLQQQRILNFEHFAIWERLLVFFFFMDIYTYNEADDTTTMTTMSFIFNQNIYKETERNHQSKYHFKLMVDSFTSFEIKWRKREQKLKRIYLIKFGARSHSHSLSLFLKYSGTFITSSI